MLAPSDSSVWKRMLLLLKLGALGAVTVLPSRRDGSLSLDLFHYVKIELTCFILQCVVTIIITYCYYKFPLYSVLRQI